MERGAQDQRCRPDLWLCKDSLPLSARSDILVFQTPALESDTEVTGRVVVKLWAASDGPDTDFTAKLCDVELVDATQLVNWERQASRASRNRRWAWSPRGA